MKSRYFFVIVIILFLNNVFVYSQNSIPSLSWARGDTIETLRTKNTNVRFQLTDLAASVGRNNQFEVNEIENHIVFTRSTFTFDDRGRLFNVLWNKQGAAEDIYQPLLRRYRAIYGNPVETNELATNRDLTGATANVKFENNLGSVHIILGVPFNGNVPFVMLIESYKYDVQTSTNTPNNRNSQNSSVEQRRINGRALFSVQWNNNGTLNMDRIINNVNLLDTILNESFHPYIGEFTNGGKYCAHREENVNISFMISNENLVWQGQLTMMFSDENAARNAINDFIRAIGGNNNIRYNDDYRTRNDRQLCSGSYVNRDRIDFYYYIQYRDNNNQYRFVAIFRRLA